MIITFSEADILSKNDMRHIQGGAEKKQGFPCRVVEADGTVRETIVNSIEECKEFAGI